MNFTWLQYIEFLDIIGPTCPALQVSYSYFIWLANSSASAGSSVR
jgi:hypothetical protein